MGSPSATSEALPQGGSLTAPAPSTPLILTPPTQGTPLRRYIAGAPLASSMAVPPVTSIAVPPGESRRSLSVPPSTPLLAQASQPSLSPDLDYIAGRVVWTAAPIREHRVLGIMGVAMLLQLCGGVSGFPYPQEFVDPGDHPFALLV